MAAQRVAEDEEGFKLRATHDFDPRQMSKRETRQLKFFLKSQGFLTKGEEILINDTVQGGILMEYLSATKQIKDTFIWKLKKKNEASYWGRSVHNCIQDLRDRERLPSKSVDLYSVVLAFKRGNEMLTIPPANIGDAIGWWMVRKLESGQIGFIPRNRIVIEIYQETSETALNELPLELLDVVLQNSFLQWIMNSIPLQKHEDVIKTLASVDFCWCQRVTRRRFRKEIWHRLKDYNRKIKRRSAIIRHNRNYLLENIQPNDEFIASLLSLNCITQEESQFIEGQRSKRDKNAEILCVVRTFDERKFSNFIRCLRKTNQKTVARIMENGGVVIKVDVQTRGADGRTSAEAQSMFHRILEDVRNRAQPWSQPTYELISRLKEDGLEILNCQLDRQTVVFWIWCHSQIALENLQRLFISNQLKDIFFDFANIEPSASEIIHSMVINIDNDQFKKTVAICPISINFTEIIDIGLQGRGQFEQLCGVTKLSNEIYVISHRDYKNIIRVFADQNPFLLLNKIEMKQYNSYSDIVSSERENCVYFTDRKDKCIWKVTKDIDDQLIVIKWLTTDCYPSTLSVSSIGQLLVVDEWKSDLRIYGSDAELIRSIHLPKEFKFPIHAVETSIGNYIIIHKWRIYLEGKLVESWADIRSKWVVTELSRDGQMVIRSFNPSNELQRLISPSYLSLDSDDRVFLADCGKDRVVLLDSDLKWNRILCPTKKEEGLETSFQRMHYDEGKKQLICTGYSQPGLNVYTLSRK